MKRIEIVDRLNLLEKRKEQFENLLNDVGDYYTKEIVFKATMDTSMFDRNRKYDGHCIKVDKIIFIGYLKEEINKIESEIMRLIHMLLEGAK